MLGHSSVPMNKFITLSFLLLLGVGCSSQEPVSSFQLYETTRISRPSYQYEDADSYDHGYEWAEDNDVSEFGDCQDEFGTSEAEDGCNDYVRDNYTGYQTFGSYDCTEDCSGHEAGYEWAENNDVYDTDDCSGYSDSFIEGCWQYVEDNY